jgi:pimeloyl-ACP methyl ester carboxylesterase
MRWIRVATTVVVAALLISACGSDPVTDTSRGVEFTPCSETECSGTLPSGAEFEILLPEDWGGSLAIFSHGLRPGSESLASADGTEVAPSSTMTASAVNSGPEPAPMWGGDDKKIADAMLQGDYAIAGASPTSSGWAVSDQIIAAEELRDYFVENVADPNRTYVWGEATGGLASARLAELHPDWVSGAAAMCAPMSGPRPTHDLALDVTYAIKEILMPNIRLVDYASRQQAMRTYDQIDARISKLAMSGDSTDAAAVAFIGAVGRLPLRTNTESGNDAASRMRAIVEGIKTQAMQSTVQRYEFEQRVGGNPSGNAGTDYNERLAPPQAALVNELDPKALEKMYAALEKGKRVSPESDAETGAAAEGELEGDLEVPVLTLHNAADPVYIAASESWYRVRTLDHGSAPNANYVDLFVLPPVTYSSDSPAPEGAGNCVFTPRTVLGVMILLNDWVRRGQYPGQDTVGEAFANGQVSITYSPGPWPSMALSPTDPLLEGEADQTQSDQSDETGSDAPEPTG